MTRKINLAIFVAGLGILVVGGGLLKRLPVFRQTFGDMPQKHSRADVVELVEMPVVALVEGGESWVPYNRVAQYKYARRWGCTPYGWIPICQREEPEDDGLTVHANAVEDGRSKEVE